MTSFNNEYIVLEDLPKVEEIPFQPLEKNYLYVELCGGILFFCIVLIGLAIGKIIAQGSFPNQYFLLAMGVGILWMLLSLAFTFWKFKKKEYALRERDICYRKGVFWKSSTVIPFNRVQHCEVNQGPIDRLWGLGKLKIFTAGGSSSDLTIPGVLPEKAHQIKDFILGKTGLDEEE